MVKYTFYDLPSKDRTACWSYNPWRNRIAFNFKKIDYVTEWVEYPDIKPKFENLIPPNPPDDKPYTIPILGIHSDDGPETYIMGTRKIVAYIEANHPTPPLHLDSPILATVYSLMPRFFGPNRGNWMPRVPVNLLPPRSKEYFFRTREAAVGKTLEEFAAEMGGDEGWTECLPAIKQIGDKLRKEEGPFFMGTTPSYADMVVLSVVQFYKRIDESLFEHLIGIEPALGTLYEAGKPWLEKDN